MCGLRFGQSIAASPAGFGWVGSAGGFVATCGCVASGVGCATETPSFGTKGGVVLSDRRDDPTHRCDRRCDLRSHRSICRGTPLACRGSRTSRECAGFGAPRFRRNQRPSATAQSSRAPGASVPLCRCGTAPPARRGARWVAATLPPPRVTRTRDNAAADRALTSLASISRSRPWTATTATRFPSRVPVAARGSRMRRRAIRVPPASRRTWCRDVRA